MKFDQLLKASDAIQSVAEQLYAMPAPSNDSATLMLHLTITNALLVQVADNIQKGATLADAVAKASRGGVQDSLETSKPRQQLTDVEQKAETDAYARRGMLESMMARSASTRATG